ncbi:hypothetical protein [Streptomyces laurentii]|uniref:hypothetical protein n=1 Tax=Streptomyces laurentii TaxID=39478 RepID=UPI0036800203
MRAFGTALAAVSLAAAALIVPATAAQATATGTASNHCDDIWPGRNGYMYAYADTNCYNKLGQTTGNDPNWNTDQPGEDLVNANDKASSVMNAGYTGSLSAVRFYYLENYSSGSNCLAASEFYVDNLGRNTFSNGENMENNIRSHKWVDATCGMWMH